MAAIAPTVQVCALKEYAAPVLTGAEADAEPEAVPEGLLPLVSLPPVAVADAVAVTEPVTEAEAVFVARVVEVEDSRAISATFFPCSEQTFA